MTELELSPLNNEGFSLIPRLAGDALEIEFTGDGDITAASSLKSFLKQVPAEAVRLGLRTIRFDFRRLAFMNSSCFKSFVTLLVTLPKDGDVLHQVEFITNPDFHWQKRSLNALQQLAPSAVRILTTTGQPALPK